MSQQKAKEFESGKSYFKGFDLVKGGGTIAVKSWQSGSYLPKASFFAPYIAFYDEQFRKTRTVRPEIIRWKQEKNCAYTQSWNANPKRKKRFIVYTDRGLFGKTFH